MKRIDKLKTVQIFVYIVLTLACILIIALNKGLFHTIATDQGVKLLCVMLWFALGAGFFFIYMDFSIVSSFKKDYRELDYAVHSDPVAGIANRYSSDVIIEKYLDRPLPGSIGCIMLEISNIKEINIQHGHREGNAAIRQFSTILKMISVGTCFVSRNGGNKFLAIFEDCSEEKLQDFVARVAGKVSVHNSEDNAVQIEFDYGTAYSGADTVGTITELIALSDRRIRNKDA
ncbi:MAG: GGDEF domain-containing protein [Clostridiales bacterium]|nr:GGDEF domain-containing protein [Candidatus Crickella merdequi]